eukprot:TRINITY_DN20047_c0_g1_i1.p1 TRINITY_DN20047_c0_g1~~TRINITY_DN20047_c0_g1_i1.p1  ORF type:complete len:398 (+),score=81.93 TRINITY_DN20047_c0_g1_i1:169-1194(+)
MNKLDNGEKIVSRLLRLLEFFEIISSVKGDESKIGALYQRLNTFLKENDVPHPANPLIRLIGLEKAPKIARSSAKPVILSLYAVECDEFGNFDPESSSLSVLLFCKFEDLRKDYIVESWLRIMNSHTPQHEIVEYDVVCVTKDFGIIDGVVDSADYNNKGSIISQAFVEGAQPGSSQRYLENFAFCTMVSFLLGFGDRHNNNIMLLYRNQLFLMFHIDFGFILGDDPFFQSLRLDDAMLSMLKDSGKDGWNDFKLISTNIYVELKRFLDISYCLTAHISPSTDLVALKQFLSLRFMPSLSAERSKEMINGVIELNKNGYGDSLRAFSHELSQTLKAYFKKG